MKIFYKLSLILSFFILLFFVFSIKTSYAYWECTEWTADVCYETTCDDYGDNCSTYSYDCSWCSGTWEWVDPTVPTYPSYPPPPSYPSYPSYSGPPSYPTYVNTGDGNSYGESCNVATDCSDYGSPWYDSTGAYCGVCQPTCENQSGSSQKTCGACACGGGGNNGTPTYPNYPNYPSQHSVTVNVNVSAGGSVSSIPSGISCGSNCVYSFDNNTSVTLVPKPSSSYWKFSGWSGDCSGVGQCVLNITGNKVVNASFAPRVFNYKEF